MIPLMKKLALGTLIAIGVAGCVYQPAPYAYAPAPAPAYGYYPAPAYYGPTVSLGFGVHGGHWHHGDRD